MWILLAAVAHANPCDKPVDVEAWRWQLARASEQLSGSNVPGGQATLNSVKNRAPCLPGRIEPADVTRLARLLAVSAFYDQELDQVDDWAKLAAAAAPMTGWPAWLDEGHPVRKYLERPPPDWSEWPGASTVEAPRRGGVFLNGVWLDEAMFPTATPCLVQVLDKHGETIDAWWQHGAAAPPGRLEVSDGKPDRPRFYEGPAVGDRRR